MLIQGGTVVSGAGEEVADVRLDGGKVTAVGAGLAPQPGEEVLDARGLKVLPGIIDAHVHLWLEGQTADDPDSATAAGLAGGVTTVVDFCVQHAGETFTGALAAARERTAPLARCDFAFHLNITHLFDGWQRDLQALVAGGVSSAKVYTTYKGSVFYTDDHVILELMRRSGGEGLLVQMHAENDDILSGATAALLAGGQTGLEHHSSSRPPEAESEAVSRGLFFNRVTGSPIYFVHLSSPLSVDLVAEARAAGAAALAETCPHYLLLDDAIYRGPDARRALMTPPLRSAAMREGLWERLAAGLIDVVGSDHCGFSLEQRGSSERFDEVNPGIPGLETLLPVTYAEGTRRGLRPADVVRLLCEAPAAVFGLAGKGRLAPGFDADVVLFDPAATGPLEDAELHGRSGFTPYRGLPLAGRVRTTLVRGEVAYAHGTVRAAPGSGRFLACSPFDRERALHLR